MAVRNSITARRTLLLLIMVVALARLQPCAAVYEYYLLPDVRGGGRRSGAARHHGMLTQPAAAARKLWPPQCPPMQLQSHGPAQEYYEDGETDWLDYSGMFSYSAQKPGVVDVSYLQAEVRSSGARQVQVRKPGGGGWGWSAAAA